MSRPRTCGVLVAFALSISQPAVTPVSAQDETFQCPADDDLFRLKTAKTETHITVHTSPASSHPAIGKLPYDARDIRCVGPCRNAWCRIAWKQIVGWVPARHLAR